MIYGSVRFNQRRVSIVVMLSKYVASVSST